MPYRLGRTSRARLHGVHSDLVVLAATAIAHPACPFDFMVGEGVRSRERQLQLYRRGATRTLNSRHLTGHAVDLWALDGSSVSWHWPQYEKLAEHIKRVADECAIRVEWGGDWETFRDGPHWQLPWSVT